MASTWPIELKVISIPWEKFYTTLGMRLTPGGLLLFSNFDESSGMFIGLAHMGACL